MIGPPTDNTASVAVQGGAAAIVAAFFRDAFLLAAPFLLVAVAVIGVDLYFGLKAAAHRGENIRASRAIRRTLGKAVEYLSWVILASTLSIAFDFQPLTKIILGVVIGIELMSIISNYLEMKGKTVTGLETFFLKLLGRKLNADTSDIVIKDKQQ